MSQTIAEKAEHVRQAMREPQPRDHTCHWPGCTAQCRPAQFSCTKHWFRIPPSLRARIWRAYRIGQENDGRASREYVEVVKAVQAWVREHYPATGAKA